ncbi:MAG: hypothetical protein AAF747_09445, partial [Planctomycetota bacterium]
ARVALVLVAAVGLLFWIRLRVVMQAPRTVYADPAPAEIERESASEGIDDPGSPMEPGDSR